MIEIALLILIVLAGLSGFRKGFIFTIGSFLGFVIATFLASRWYEGLSSTFGGSTAAEIIAFIALYVLISALVSWGFGLINSTFNLVAIIPGMKLINRLGGAILGLVEGALFIGMAVIIIRYVTGNDFLADVSVAEICVTIASVFIPLLPDVVKNSDPLLNL